MNNSLHTTTPDCGLQPAPATPRTKEKPPSARKLSAASRLILLLTGLLFLWCGAPAAHADRSPTNCTGSGLGISLFTSLPDVHIGDTIRYSINVFNGIAGTGRIVCDATNITAFIVTPDGLTNNVTLLRTFLRNGEFDFYPDVVSYVVRAQDIQPDGTLLARARDIGTIHQNDTDSIGGGFQGLNTEVNLPCVQLLAVCVGGVGENGLITVSGTVTNCGNNTLVGVVITNMHDGGLFTVVFPTNLARGQSAPFTISYTPVNPCAPSTAMLTVRATDEFTATPRTVTSSVTVICQNTLTARIQVTKVCPPGPVAPGQFLTFSGSVLNTGNVTLTNIVVLNNQPAANTPVFTLASLAPGASASFTGSYLAPTNCSVTDTLTATAASRCGVPVSAQASATCPIFTTPQILVTAVCPVAPVAPGGVLTYTGTVRNTGDITLRNVVVTSDRPAANTTVFIAATLAPGASASFTGSYTVPADICGVLSTLRATGADNCTSVSVTNISSFNCGVTAAPAIAVTLACPVAPATAGGLITYTGTVRNSGNITLNNVNVVNNQSVPSTVFTVASLAPGAIASFTASFTTAVDACSVSSTVTATGNDNCLGGLVSGTATATCSVGSTPAIAVTLVCPVTPATPGSLLAYSGTVRNTGNITLTNVVVLNNLSGATPVLTIASLAPGATATYSGNYLAPTNCSSTSTSTATGRSVCGVAVSGTVSTTCPILTTPIILVTVVCPVTPVVPGGVLTYTGTVRNTGDITLRNVVVTSDRPAANTTVFTAVTLAPGASANFTGSYTVPADVCAVTAAIRATGIDTCTSVSVTNIFLSTCTVTTAPAIAVTLACPATPATAGGLITYTGTVRNSGNVTLTNVTVVNSQSVPSTVFTVASLAPGVVASFTASFTAAGDACTVISTVTATGINKCGSAMVSSSASATCPLLTTPGLVVTKVCPPTPVRPGAMLTFSGTVINTGNVTLTNIVVLNNQPSANTPVFTLASLAPGAVASFTGSYVAPLACSVSDTLTATGRSICGVSVANFATAVCPIVTAPAILVTQVCPVVQVVPGANLTYTGTVRNIGDITLTNIVVFNNRSGSGPIFTLASLAPGASANFSGTYLTHADCCVDSSTVTARGQDCTGTTVSDTDTRTCTLSTTPRIVVTKVCPPGSFRPGDLLNYSGSVSNAGNITLVNVTVVNNQPGNNTTVLGPIILAPGESVSYYASYVVPADFCGNDTVTASGQDLCTLVRVSNSTTTTCPVVTTPRIGVTKICPPTATLPGSLFTFTGSVTNLGNVTLVNVYVVNNQPTNNAPVIGPLTLAPGASATFSGSYLAPLNCCDIIDTLTARGQDRCTGSNVAATATAVCPLVTNPAILVVQNCPPAPIPMGSVYNFSGYVTNTGNVVLTNVFVFGPLGTNSPVLGPMELAPGESERFSGSYTVPFDTCNVIVTASGHSTCSTCTNCFLSSAAACPVATTTSLLITQACPASPTVMGSALTYSGTVRNAGNITLTNISVVNNQSGLGPVFTLARLAPGAVANFNGSYLAPVACDSTSTSTASATSICGVLVATSASSTCPIVTTPAIAVTQVCPVGPVVPGGTLVYTGTVTNTGNITLTNVLVVSSQPVPNTLVFGPVTLAPGAGTNFVASYVAPAACAAGSTVTAQGSDSCTGLPVSNNALANCALVTTPGILVTQVCPVSPAAPGSLLTYTGTVRNTGNIMLTNISVVNNLSGSTPVFTADSLAPGAVVGFTGSYLAPTSCSGSSTATATGRSICGIAVTNGSTATCTLLTSPALAVTRTCPAGPGTPGQTLVFTGTVTNTGNVTLTNVFVVYDQPVPNTPVLGPITLAPGAGTNFAGSYIVPGTTNFSTNAVTTITTNQVTTITTNSSNVITTNTAVTVATNTVAPTFGTIDPVLGTLTDRFNVVSNLHGLMFKNQDSQWGPVLFYTTRHPATGPDQLVTISTLNTGINTVGAVSNRFALTQSNYVALTFAAPDVGAGEVNLYYLRTNSGSVYTFGQIISQGMSTSADFPPNLPNTGYKALAFAEPNLSTFGANLFHFIREDTLGVATMGTISIAGAMVVTDRYPVGTNANFDSLVYVPGTVSTWGSSLLAYLRHDTTGSILGTIDPVTRVVTDRLNLGTNLLSDLTFTATDVGYGANLFYYLRPERTSLTTNTVTTFTTNAVPVFTTNTTPVFTTNTVTTLTTNIVAVAITDTITARGTDICQARTVTTQSTCSGSLRVLQPVFGGAGVPPPSVSGGTYSMSFATQSGVSYTVQFKNALSAPTWTDLPGMPVMGTGGNLTIPTPTAGQPTRFYRVILTP